MQPWSRKTTMLTTASRCRFSVNIAAPKSLRYCWGYHWYPIFPLVFLFRKRTRNPTGSVKKQVCQWLVFGLGSVYACASLVLRNWHTWYKWQSVSMGGLNVIERFTRSHLLLHLFHFSISLTPTLSSLYSITPYLSCRGTHPVGFCCIYRGRILNNSSLFSPIL